VEENDGEKGIKEDQRKGRQMWPEDTKKEGPRFWLILKQNVLFKISLVIPVITVIWGSPKCLSQKRTPQVPPLNAASLVL
jgi:hypothetical protein